MKAKPLLLSHVAAGILGLALARTVASHAGGPDSSLDGVQGNRAAALSNSIPPSVKSGNELAEAKGFSRRDFEAAWKAFPGSGLSPRERIDTQRRLLRE